MFTGNTGLNWGGEYSRWNYDESKAYLMVAKMQREPGTSNGIPLLDAELNENSEILLGLIRRLIHRIHGNGSMGNGFKITQSSANPNNNFTITGGDGTTSGAGVIFVDGWMPAALTNQDYTSQSYGPAALTTPASDRVDHVYIDVYYKEVDYKEDADIKDTNVNLETSRRIALVWEVKVAEGSTTPSNYVDGNNIQHFCHQLAIINRKSGNAAITTDMIVDTRNRDRLIKRNHIHEQTIGASTWTINHYLGTTKLLVLIVDNSGNEMEPAISHPNNSTTVLDFGGVNVTGTALFNAIEA
ncbi:MAG: DUF6519 domain-containing protein [Desulfobacterales bacterium]|nr:DUF6519 domain-containing protein [Desulfobacterales bacterium]